MTSRLRDHFAGVGVKHLTAVDAEPSRSNQHEIGTTSAMRKQFLGADQQRRFDVVYVWIGDDRDPVVARGEATHYDTRAAQAGRSPEWRLYYGSNAVTEAMREGDTLFLALDSAGRLLFIVTPSASSMEGQLLWLFDLTLAGRTFASRAVAEDESELGFAARLILEQLGVEVGAPDSEPLDALIDDFDLAFPPTKVFSERARASLPGIDPLDDPDIALVAWLDREEAMFRRLERRIVANRLEMGFLVHDDVDVDGFLQFSLSVQNRRKVRMGQSLENHLEAVFNAFGVAHVRGGVTEDNHRPDFLFPSLSLYRAAPEAGDSRLTMLGAKSTCKERWRQVLTEASKIPDKHLLTLEPGITERQTAQMRDANLQLVVPSPIHQTYRESQRVWLWDLRCFVNEVAGKEEIGVSGDHG